MAPLQGGHKLVRINNYLRTSQEGIRDLAGKAFLRWNKPIFRFKLLEPRAQLSRRSDGCWPGSHHLYFVEGIATRISRVLIIINDSSSRKWGATKVH